MDTTPDPMLRRFLDQQLRLTAWPRRDAQRVAALSHLASRFAVERTYREKEVNELLRGWHLFNDPALLRRELFDRGYLDRTKDGSRYWRVKLATVRFY